jgi:hypothetical protein
MRVLLLTIVLLVASACAPAQESTGSASVSRQACQVGLLGDWNRALVEGRVDTGKWSVPMAVGPGGEVIARRADDVVLIDPDKSVSTVYTFPESAEEYANVVELNERWIVLGISGPTDYEVSTKLTRIAVIDRDDGSNRTIADISDADYRAGRNMLQSVALFGDTVYWITHDNVVPEGGGTLRSHDLNTGTEADVESGSMRNLRATATGLAWTSFVPEERVVFRALEPVPAALSTLSGINEDQTTLVRDGDVYAWITGVAQGGTGIARWSPDTGLTRISTVPLFAGHPAEAPPVYIAGPHVLLGQEDAEPSTLVDTRSGALTLLEYPVVGAAHGTIAIQIGGWGASSVPNTGSVRTESLPPLSCSSSDSVRPSCEVSLPGTWRQALESHSIVTGGTTEPLAVGPAGEVAASYEDDRDRRLLLIDNRGSMNSVYRVRDPGVEKVGFASVSARWIVVGVDIDPRVRNDGRWYLGDDGEPTADNAPPARLVRIDVIDRANNAVRTVYERTGAGGDRDSLAVFGDTVFWSTEGVEPGDDTVVRSYDLNTNAVVQVAAADRVEDIRATPIGVVWTRAERDRVPHRVTDLPTGLTGAGVAPDDATLVSDGTSYAWLTDRGIAHWSPESGVTHVATINMWRSGPKPIQFVVGPYVVVEGSQHGAGEATVVDARTGAVTTIDATVVAAGGGTVATRVPQDRWSQSTTGLLRLADLPPLTC